MLIDARCKFVARSQKSRARGFGLTEHFTGDEWLDLLIQSEYKCASCSKSSPDVLIQPDHIVPLSKGGANTIDNIQVLCRECNLRKNTKSIDFRNGIETFPAQDVSKKKKRTSGIVFRLKEIAQAKSLNRNQISIQSKTSPPAVRRWWNNEVDEIDLVVLDRFCKFFDCDVSDLIEMTTTTQDTKP